MKLVLKEFRCLSQDDNFGGDSPYFIVFKGRTGQPAEIDRLRKKSWEGNITSGKFVSANVTAFSNISSGDYVLAHVVEQDDGLDLEGSDYNNMANYVKNAWSINAQMGFAPQFVLEMVMPLMLASGVNKNIGNDDAGGLPQKVSIPGAPGLCPLIHLSTDGGGLYRVRFEVKA